jgi:hypothetical protein
VNEVVNVAGIVSGAFLLPAPMPVSGAGGPPPAAAGFVAWLLSPDPNPPAIDYQLAVGGPASMAAPMVMTGNAYFWVMQPWLGVPVMTSGTF